jgi:hypothetical protein
VSVFLARGIHALANTLAWRGASTDLSVDLVVVVVVDVDIDGDG